MTRPVSVVLLAAGYGTRLYPLTKDCPKALLSLGRRVVLDVILESVRMVPEVSRIVLVTNRRFLGQFQSWQATQDREVELVDDGTTSAETRLGAIRDLLLGVGRVGTTEDLLVLGSDNLFTWSLADFVTFAQSKRPAATITLRQAPSAEEARRCAVVVLDQHNRVIQCMEKPSRPESLTVGLCVYYFPAPVRVRIEEFMRRGGNVDAPGYFIEWLVKQEAVYGYMTDGEWFDIGSRESYDQVVQRWAQSQH